MMKKQVFLVLLMASLHLVTSKGLSNAALAKLEAFKTQLAKEEGADTATEGSGDLSSTAASADESTTAGAADMTTRSTISADLSTTAGFDIITAPPDQQSPAAGAQVKPKLSAEAQAQLEAFKTQLLQQEDAKLAAAGAPKKPKAVGTKPKVFPTPNTPPPPVTTAITTGDNQVSSTTVSNDQSTTPDAVDPIPPVQSTTEGAGLNPPSVQPPSGQLPELIKNFLGQLSAGKTLKMTVDIDNPEEFIKKSQNGQSVVPTGSTVGVPITPPPVQKPHPRPHPQIPMIQKIPKVPMTPKIPKIPSDKKMKTEIF